MERHCHLVRAGRLGGRILRCAVLVLLWPALLAAAPTAMDSRKPLARAAAEQPVSVSRIVVGLVAALQPAPGQVIDDALRERLEARSASPSRWVPPRAPATRC